MFFIDINCDVGEGFDNEAKILPYISSCNIACGGHAGNVKIIDNTISIAIKNKVKIGAHPSYPDKENFGRKVLEIGESDLKESLKSQIDVLVERLQNQHQELHHIKPHGALYNEVAKNKKIASIVLEVITNYPSTYLYVPYNSVIEKLALKKGVKIKYEAFADRNYNENLTLVSRVNEKALITDVSEIAKHLQGMIKQQKVNTVNQNLISIKADTFCFHTDNSTAVNRINKVIEILKQHQIYVVK